MRFKIIAAFTNYFRLKVEKLYIWDIEGWDFVDLHGFTLINTYLSQDLRK